MNVFNDVILNTPNVLISKLFSHLKTNISQIIEKKDLVIVNDPCG